MYVPPELKVLQPRPGMAVVEVLGEHDLSTNDEAEALFGPLVTENELVVIDLTETAFIDSSFLAILIKTRTAAADRGHAVVLQIGRDSTVRRTLAMTRMLNLFEHVSTREEALAWVGGDADTPPS
jgi:anti-anti-sigma factor